MRDLKPVMQSTEVTMDSSFTSSDRDLVMQFLKVLHTWCQDARREKQNELEVLQLQEGVIKLLYARLTGGEELTPEEIVQSAETIFDDKGEETQEPVADLDENKVIDFAAWKPARTKEEDDENNE